MAGLKGQISEATKTAMKARDKERVAALRLINAEIKRFEVDERKDPDDADVLTLLGRMLKQRNDSLTQYTDAGRDDLASRERFEIDVIGEFMPVALNDQELAAEVSEAIQASGASSMKDMGKVMAHLKASLQGRADMGRVSNLVKEQLS